MVKFVLYTCLFFLATGIVAQVDPALLEQERLLKKQLDDLRMAPNNAEKEKRNEIFRTSLAETIKKEGAFDYPFKSLSTLGRITSPDKAFRLFNWNVEQDDKSNKYYCFVLRFDRRKKEWKVTELIDNSIMLPARPDGILYDDNWYGALYYKIIPVEKSGKTSYTVLGLDANGISSHTKLIDVMSFSGNRVKLGGSIFKMDDGTHKRLFFEHSSKAYMSINYDQERQRIIYDHLMPESPSMEGFYEYYVPDMSYDQLNWIGNKWVLQENVIGVNEKGSRSVSIKYQDPNGNHSGDVRSLEVKNKWVDPSDPNAPGGANVHVARLPGDEELERKKNSNRAPEEPQLKKGKSKKNEFSMNPFIKGKNRKKQ